ncbi:MAG: hypothetical protein IPN33_26560 [Saprospiraceae bacterium]|nr:hypothetical protein [Saprospiraceae bacterium]
MGYNTLALFVLPQADRLVQDIRLYIKTEKYYKQNISSTNNPSLSRIIFEKQQQNVQRKRQLTTLLGRLLSEAAVYMNGSKHDTGNTADGKTKVINAFQDLVKLAYPNLKMLGDIAYNEDVLKNILRSRQDDLFGADETTISEAESEVFNLIVRRKRQSDRTSIADLRDHFSRKPYGWYMNATLCVTARLYKRGKIEARQDSNLLSDEDFLANLLNNRTFSNTLLEPQMEFDQRLVRQMKEVFQDLFDETCPATEARDIANHFKERAKKEVRELHQLIGNKAQYPFLENLEDIANTLDRLAGMDYSVLLNNLPEFEDNLLDQKEAVLDPIRKFWNGEQKKIFDRINTFLNGDQSNFDFVDAAELQVLRNIRNNAKPYEGNAIREAKEAMEALTKKVQEQIEAEKEKTLHKIAEGRDQIVTQDDFTKLEPAKQQKVTAPMDQLSDKVKEQRYIATLRQYANQVPDMVAEQLTALQKLVHPDEQILYVPVRNVKIHFNKTELSTVADVDEYLRIMREEMLMYLQQNRRIKL